MGFGETGCINGQEKQVPAEELHLFQPVTC